MFILSYINSDNNSCVNVSCSKVNVRLDEKRILMDIVSPGDSNTILKLLLPIIILLIYLLMFGLSCIFVKDKKIAAIVPFAPMVVVFIILIGIAW